jgi:hypothetical protein
LNEDQMEEASAPQRRQRALRQRLQSSIESSPDRRRQHLAPEEREWAEPDAVPFDQSQIEGS